MSTLVTSAAELADALEAEARDIVLTAHIDLRSLQLQRSQDNIFIVKGGTRTLRGDCTLEQKPVPADAADQILITEDLLPGQCVIYGIGRILTILVEVSTWVEGIVAAQEVPTKELFGDGGGSGAYVLSLEKGSLYLTQSAVISKLGVQHDPDTPSLLPALQIGYEARAAYIEETQFRGSGYFRNAMVTANGTATFRNCGFGPANPHGGRDHGSPPYCFMLLPSDEQLVAGQTCRSGSSARHGGRVRIVESEFETTGSSMDYEVCRMSQEPELLVYSDETMQVGFWRAAEVPSLPLSSANEPSFLTQDDFHTVRNEILGISKGPSVPIWAVVLLAVVGTVVAALGTMYLFSYRRSTKAASKHGRSSGSSNGGDKLMEDAKSHSGSGEITRRVQASHHLHIAPDITEPHLTYGSQQNMCSAHYSVLPGESEGAVNSTCAPTDWGQTEQHYSSVLMSMQEAHSMSYVSDSYAAGPADMNVNHSTNPPTVSTFPATTKPGQVGSSFQDTSQALPTSKALHHDQHKRRASVGTEVSHSFGPRGQRKLSLANAGTSFEMSSQPDLPSSALQDFLKSRVSEEPGTVDDDFSVQPPDIDLMTAQLEKSTSRASVDAPLALGGIAHSNTQGSKHSESESQKNRLSSTGSGSRRNTSGASKRPTSGKQRQKSPSPPRSFGQRASPTRNTRGSGEGTSSARPPQVQLQKALQLPPTQAILRDLETVPQGFALHGYSLLPSQMWRTGGQGVVCFVLDASSRQFVMKFMAQSAFRAECALYDHPVLSRFLPQRHKTITPQQAKAAAASCEDEAAVRALQWPCLVLEQGDDLRDICKRRDDVLSAYQIRQALFEIGMCLKELHDANYVHRDIKPSNVLHLPGRQVWRLIDCGLAAKVGAAVPVGFTRPYGPPEAIAADIDAAQATSSEEKHRAKILTVSPALDAWSFGVLAFELVTSPTQIKPAITGTISEINAQILGVDGRELPWEGSNRAAAEEQLGSLAEPVLGLLQRNPEDRWTLERFCAVVYPRCGGHVHQ